jgi:DNA-binding NarL/FixJ family response regulator
MAGGRVVVADDDVLLREGIARILSGAGYEVVAQAADRGELEDRVREHVPDLVVVDIHLGDEDGVELARRLSEQPEAPPVVLISTRSADEVLELLDDGSAIGFLAKKALGADALLEILDHRAPR